MIYLESNYNNYKYLVDCSDNYIVLSTRSRVVVPSGDSVDIPVIYKYFQPSFITLESNYNIYESTNFSDVSHLFSDSIYDRPDFPQIFICGFIIFVIFAFVLNNLTKLVHKGGIFGDH